MKFLKDRAESAFFLAVIAAICGGSVPVTAKIALEVFHPFTLVAIRFFFATLFLLPFVIRSGDLKLENIKKFWLVGLIGALNPIFLFIALQYTQASVSPLIYAGVPALTALYLYMANGEKIAAKQITGILVGLVGVGIIVVLPLFEKHIAPSALQGNLLIVLAAVAFVYYGIISKKASTNMKASPVALTFYFSLITFLVSLPFIVYEYSRFGVSAHIQISHISSGIFTGVVGTGIFYWAYQAALKKGSEVAAGLFTFLQPISTIILAALFIGERITISFVVGGVLAVVGARLAARK